MPTSSSGGTGMREVPLRISESTPGAILQPQPPPWDSEVNLTGSFIPLSRSQSVSAPYAPGGPRGQRQGDHAALGLDLALCPVDLGAEHALAEGRRDGD